MLQAINEFSTVHNNTWQFAAVFKGHEDFIFKIENQVIFIFPYTTILNTIPLYSKEKISSLRGKLSKQPEDKIDKQIHDLRNEWENF